jgi:uncharacterized protein
MARLAEPSHDAEHVRRVAKMADHLGQVHGADREILQAAALLHDLGRADPESGRPHVELSVEAAERLMEEVGFPPDKREPVLHCIRAHSYSRGIPPETLEARLLRDADRLDALGAIGIVRTFAYGRAFYDPQDPLAKRKSAPEGNRYCVEHFFEKLFQLPEGLFSPEARRIARERVAFMRAFLDQMEREIGGRA